MTGEEERREVAKRMRDYARLRSPDTFEAFFTRLNGVLFGDDGLERPDGEIFGRLADLIDPTCNILSGDESNHAMHCSVCGCAFLGLRYCSGCGARVVE